MEDRILSDLVDLAAWCNAHAGWGYEDDELSEEPESIVDDWFKETLHLADKNPVGKRGELSYGVSMGSAELAYELHLMGRSATLVFPFRVTDLEDALVAVTNGHYERSGS